MLREGGSPVLIDPRGYFGFTALYGDIRYDWAKLYYSIAGNYDQFNLKNFQLEIGKNEVWLKVGSNNWEDYVFWQDFVKNYQLSNNDYVIVFPHETARVNKCGIDHLEQFMKYGPEEKKQIILLCIGNEVPELVKLKLDKS